MSRAVWLRAATLGLLVLIPLLGLSVAGGVFSYWVLGLERIGNETLGENFIVLAEAPPVPERRAYGLLAVTLPVALWLYGLWRLFVMFLRFYRGERIGLDTVRHLRAFALFCLLATMSAFLLSGTMRWAAGAFDDAPLWTHLLFSSTHAALLFLSAIVYVASHLIEEGYEYRDELDKFV